MATIRYLEAMFGLGPEQEHIAVPAKAGVKLKEMVDDLLGTDDMIAIYIPEGTDDVYQNEGQRGRVVGAVKLLQMPANRTVDNYFFNDLLTRERRWPIGWPCQVVYFPPNNAGPLLRNLVDLIHGPGNFQPFVGGLQHGPKKLDLKMAKRLLEELSPFPVR
ncbi:hypothetical protein JYK02_01020 [Corallococcus macrosporus]|uniref:Uncharacterized protein n=1 Tax=Corallococcus macrosporus TaxID=35 RepID=A0ABS3D367_9BACT|nr:hypothetical protein [Corallococcus macrosporus]MBN8226086.1 hypothetical protein [Corallococcus macrosporus]